MRVFVNAVAVCLPLALASCVGTSKPALIYTSAGEVFTGSGANTADGGVLLLRSEAGASCQTSLPKIGWGGSTSSGNLQCTDGRTATVEVRKDSDGTVRNGTVQFADGETGSLVVGNVAERMIAALPSTNYGSGEGSSGCKSAGYYGEMSCLTGRAKTVHVSSYRRKDGTYVRSHYRSRPR